MAKTVPTFEIETGPYADKINAQNPDLAIQTFWEKRDRSKAGGLLRFREIPWNTEYKWDAGKEKRRGSWYYLSVSNGHQPTAAGKD